MSQLVTLG